MTWQPIETAPAEGPYLVYGGTCFSDLNDEGEAALVTKVDGREGASKCLSAYPDYAVSDVCYYSVWISNPTHWMPLPAAPKEQG